MKYLADSPEEYIDQLSEPRKSAFIALRNTVRENLPSGFVETMQNGMITFVVPFSLYPAGYRANPKDPLPFLSVASQKQYISLYHMGIYVFPEILDWFRGEYDKAGLGKLDMGKSCIRFKRESRIPFDLIARLCKKIPIEEYILKASSRQPVETELLTRSARYAEQQQSGQP